MKLTISLIAILGSLLFISPIFGDEKLQCKSNQECIKLRDCPYTKELLTSVLSSSDRAEKNNMMAEMRKLVCNPLDRSVCCNKEESEAEVSKPEAEGDHEESEAEAEGDYEVPEPEVSGDHYYESEPEYSGDCYYDCEVEAKEDHEDPDPEAEGDHEESNIEAEGEHEASEAEAEGDHEDSEPEASGDYNYESELECSGGCYYDSEVEVEAKDDHEESEAVSEGSGYDDQNRTMDTLGRPIRCQILNPIAKRD